MRAPSMVSIRHMPAAGCQMARLRFAKLMAYVRGVPVKRIGKIRITQILVPFVAWIDEIPSRAISEDVSNPSPKSTPNGYIFQGLYRQLSANRHAAAFAAAAFEKQTG